MDLRKILWMAIALGALAARGEDLTTLQNVTYTNVKVRRHDPQGILVQHEGGETKIPYADILLELREYYKRMASDLTPAKEAAAPEPPPEPNDLAVRGGRWPPGPARPGGAGAAAEPAAPPRGGRTPGRPRPPAGPGGWGWRPPGSGVPAGSRPRPPPPRGRRR